MIKQGSHSLELKGLCLLFIRYDIFVISSSSLELSSDQIPTGSHAYVLVMLVFVMVNFLIFLLDIDLLQFYNLLTNNLSFDD
jgi:hypothetical protein